MTSIDLRDIDTRWLTDDSTCWITASPYAELVSLAVLGAETARDEIVVALRAPPGIELPRHVTTGPATILTVQGRWKLREKDWVAGPGSLVVVPAATCHTPLVLGDNTDDVVVLILVTGDVSFLDGAGRVLRTSSLRTACARYLEQCGADGNDARKALA